MFNSPKIFNTKLQAFAFVASLGWHICQLTEYGYIDSMGLADDNDNVMGELAPLDADALEREWVVYPDPR